MVGEVGSSAGLELCGVGHGFAGVRLPVLSLRASTWLSRQQKLLRALVLRLLQTGLVVEVRLVPGALQPADPPSRLDSNYQSSMQRACSRAFQLWRVLLAHPQEMLQVGGLVL